MNFIREIREAGRKLPLDNPLRHCALSAADEVAGRLMVVAGDPTRETMIALNGAWANAERVLKQITETAPSGNGGAMPVEQQRRAA